MGANPLPAPIPRHFIHIVFLSLPFFITMLIIPYLCIFSFSNTPLSISSILRPARRQRRQLFADSFHFLKLFAVHFWGRAQFLEGTVFSWATAQNHSIFERDSLDVFSLSLLLSVLVNIYFNLFMTYTFLGCRVIF